MRTPTCILPGLAILVLAACRVPAPEPLTAAEQMEWQGLQGCADCEAIDTVLVLSRDGGQQRFEMVETYLLQGGGEPFADAGAWQYEDSLIRLQGDEGSMRTYALLGDGRLQSRQANGSRERRAHELQPVSGVPQ
ncbi:copper resistance protein NlpE [Luteimonas yindakuii]|uniref:Copper resistance protein NlpE n=1 Tax=Luteimonas yindakuii TaxID=2565782 RepID=A0A4Z1R9U1_9GAMM|nr:copper resistance protein NlpE N-terminal domain-containing protein [Luteimonas yindakuii]TKS52923.1 copper resistance protein NlpE [Luteimonas yindakuii]